MRGRNHIEIENNIGNRRKRFIWFSSEDAWLAGCAIHSRWYSHIFGRLLCATFLQRFACSFFSRCRFCCFHFYKIEYTKLKQNKKMTQLNASYGHRGTHTTYNHHHQHGDDCTVSHSLSGISSLLFLCCSVL